MNRGARYRKISGETSHEVSNSRDRYWLVKSFTPRIFHISNNYDVDLNSPEGRLYSSKSPLSWCNKSISLSNVVVVDPVLSEEVQDTTSSSRALGSGTYHIFIVWKYWRNKEEYGKIQGKENERNICKLFDMVSPATKRRAEKNLTRR